MEVYLAQHGEAKPESEDPERSLTHRGSAEVESVARHVASSGLKVVRIIHSGKLRAKQTAELFARYLSPPEGGVSGQKGLGPLDDPQEAQQLVQRTENPIMVVGHLPHLSRLASQLVMGDADQEVIKFTMGGLVCLVGGDGGWSVGWILIPQLVEPTGNGV